MMVEFNDLVIGWFDYVSHFKHGQDVICPVYQTASSSFL